MAKSKGRDREKEKKSSKKRRREDEPRSPSRERRPSSHRKSSSSSHKKHSSSSRRETSSSKGAGRSSATKDKKKKSKKDKESGSGSRSKSSDKRKERKEEGKQTDAPKSSVQGDFSVLCNQTWFVLVPNRHSLDVSAARGHPSVTFLHSVTRVVHVHTWEEGLRRRGLKVERLRNLPCPRRLRSLQQCFRSPLRQQN